jgi:hypothetical protein
MGMFHQMKLQVAWLLKYIIAIFTCILQCVSVEIPNTRNTEFDKLFYPAIHCLYCNPAAYPHGLLWYAVMIPIGWTFNNNVYDLMAFAFIDMAILI